MEPVSGIEMPPARFSKEWFKKNFIPAINNQNAAIFWFLLHLGFIGFSGFFFSCSEVSESWYVNHKHLIDAKWRYKASVVLGYFCAWILLLVLLGFCYFVWQSARGKKFLFPLVCWFFAIALPTAAVYWGSKPKDEDSLISVILLACGVICLTCVFNNPNDFGVVDTLLAVAMSTVFNIHNNPQTPKYKNRFPVICVLGFIVGGGRILIPFLSRLLLDLAGKARDTILPTAPNGGPPGGVPPTAPGGGATTTPPSGVPPTAPPRGGAPTPVAPSGGVPETTTVVLDSVDEQVIDLEAGDPRLDAQPYVGLRQRTSTSSSSSNRPPRSPSMSNLSKLSKKYSAAYHRSGGLKDKSPIQVVRNKSESSLTRPNANQFQILSGYSEFERDE